ncbi:hypothetical protein SDC9_190865 [bioreactor metagenome]|uniref:Uncharacterized protein n=1 Tax=bioreactor metagenome TaxID=1076179 RepID=A0A645HXH2_9ZZZZ
MVIIINVSLLEINSSTGDKKNDDKRERSDEEAGEWNFYRRSIEQRIGSP